MDLRGLYRNVSLRGAVEFEFRATRMDMGFSMGTRTKGNLQDELVAHG
jgi:hypothetical protein